MNKKTTFYFLIFFPFFYSIFTACNDAKEPPATDIAKTPEELDIKASDIIYGALKFAEANEGKIDDTSRLVYTKLMQSIYESNQFATLWSSKEQWRPLADSLMRFIAASKLYGLFPADYHFTRLDSLNQSFLIDTLAIASRTDAVKWAKADLMLTDGFLHIIKDLKLGRLPADSMTQRKDSVLSDSFYLQQLQTLQQNNSLTAVFQSVEPTHRGYKALKEGIKQFLDSADNRVYTIVPVKKESVGFAHLLHQRLYQGGYIAYDSIQADSVQLSEAVKNFQRSKEITVDGKAGNETIRLLNESDNDKFVRIAIALDRYKMLPEKMPFRYVWVNLPGYSMTLIEDDSVLLTSRIICGKNITRTPVLTSAISDMITYPQWTIPNSIIVKEILPALKRDTNYLARKGYSLIDVKGDVINPGSVDWTKYKKGIPYKVVQGSGDENALGILKFNFPNKYAVYLHDTNQRYLFSRAMRSLSHGCVRVQQWKELANYIIRYDYRDRATADAVGAKDSLDAWLERKEKHTIPVKQRLPVYIRYFTCEGKGGKILFYDDIYGEDKMLREKFLAGK
jgi:murein L,D-transpeptidase YcbB/YkuD